MARVRRSIRISKGRGNILQAVSQTTVLLFTVLLATTACVARRVPRQHAVQEIEVVERNDVSEGIQSNVIKLTESINLLNKRIETLENNIKIQSDKLNIQDSEQDPITRLERIEKVEIVAPSLSSHKTGRSDGDYNASNILFADDPDGQDTSKPIRMTATQLYDMISEQVAVKASHAIEYTLSRVMESHMVTMMHKIDNSIKQIDNKMASDRRRHQQSVSRELELQTETIFSKISNLTKEYETCSGELQICRQSKVFIDNPGRSQSGVVREKGGPNQQLSSPLQPSLNIPASGGLPTNGFICNADEATVSTLSEVKLMLRSVMSASEDLRRSVTHKTSEGLDLLQLLHQRFAVLLRRINYQPDTSLALISEMQELENLVENSYSSILTAQNVFIESCHRIQDEEPVVEAKITDILDKVVTSINLGQQYNREQLNELRRLISRIKFDNSSVNFPVEEPVTAVPGSIVAVDLIHDPFREEEIKHMHERISENININSNRIEDVASRVSHVQSQLTSWSHGNLYKNELDQLVTAAKDLSGSASLQQSTLDDISQSLASLITVSRSSIVHGKLYLGNLKSNGSIVFPQSCTDAISDYLNNPLLNDASIGQDYDNIFNRSEPNNLNEFDYYSENGSDKQYISYDLKEDSYLNENIENVNNFSKANTNGSAIDIDQNFYSN